MFEFVRLLTVIIVVLVVICLHYSAGLIQINEQYYISESNETFIHAFSDCKLVGMDLARIDNASVEARLVNLLSSAGVANDTGLFWVGGVHRNGDSWMWVESGQYFNYTNWGPTEPRYANSEDYCLQFGMGYKYEATEDHWKWEASLCRLERYYICQKNGYYS